LISYRFGRPAGLFPRSGRLEGLHGVYFPSSISAPHE
jgi:hypothetical protein